MTVKKMRELLEPFFDEDEVITLKTAAGYTGPGDGVLHKFGLQMMDDTPTVVGGLLPLGLLIARPRELVDRLERDATAEGFERDINDPV